MSGEVYKMAKVFFEKEVQGEMRLLNVTTPSGGLNVQAYYVKAMVPNGAPFWWFATIPVGKIVGCDFTSAPLKATTTAEIMGQIEAIDADPAVVLSYDPPLTA